MNAIEQQILEKVSHLETEQQKRVLKFVEGLMTIPEKHYTAVDLMRLPLEQRNAILREQLAQAANEEFEDFEAYSEEDFCIAAIIDS